MTTYYVGPGGNDGNAGTSWATRRLTLNGIEDKPVAAGDIVWVAPGVYREQLTCDVSGSSGAPIVFAADVTGENTDGVGGAVRVTGSDNDTVATRASCIVAVGRTFRTFRGFALDTGTGALIEASGNPGNWIVEDCTFQSASIAARFAGSGVANVLRRCVILSAVAGAGNVVFTHTATVNDTGDLVENCLFFGGNGRGVETVRVGGITVNGCTFLGPQFNCVRVATALASGQTIGVYNCVFAYTNAVVLQATTAAEFVEDYNVFYVTGTLRSSVNAGSNSSTSAVLLDLPLLLAGYRFPPAQFGALHPDSPLRAMTLSNPPAADLHGVARPANGKASIGAIQHSDRRRETATKRTGAASLRLSDAGRHQMFAPTAGTAITVACYVYREAGYTGSLPQLIVRQAGQADVTDTATGAAGAWEELSVTLTPAANPAYVVVELVSRNTAAAGSYAVFFDDLVVV